MTSNRTLVLAANPEGIPGEQDFRIDDLDIRHPDEGEILVKVKFASLDPGIRMALGVEDTYWVPTLVGSPLTSNVVGEVIESRHPDYKAGDTVTGTGQLAEYATFAPGPMCWRIPDDLGLPLSNSLAIVGATGLTAYFGMLEIGQPKAGETVLVSAAAGAVGSAAGQIAKIKGCRTVGIAGGPDKCRKLMEEYGFDAAIDYRGKSLQQLTDDIREACPNGVDVYFENVGGRVLDAALANMNWGGRIPVCGLISEYNLTDAPEPLHNLFAIVGKTLRVEGFLSFVWPDRFPEAIRDMAGWINEGRLVAHEDVAEGIEAAPAHFASLFLGTNSGKTLVRISD